MPGEKVRVILITDGDSVAQSVVETLAAELGLRCISASAGNPTPIDGPEIVRLLKLTPRDPVLVMFDDKGLSERGEGECALEFVATHPDVEVLGAVAVASNALDYTGARVDACVTAQGAVVNAPVNKKGEIVSNRPGGRAPVVRGDTVDVLNELDLPVVIGIGDIGKMKRCDDLLYGAPVTRRAIKEILRRNHIE